MSAYISSGTRPRRLRRQLPDIKIAVGLWSVDEVVTRVSDAVGVLRQRADAGERTNKQETSKRSARR